MSRLTSISSPEFASSRATTPQIAADVKIITLLWAGRFGLSAGPTFLWTLSPLYAVKTGGLGVRWQNTRARTYAGIAS